ncbi:MAG: Na+/H+ antiporter subunit E, partial [Sedimenticolaceae bacterium]
VRFAPLSARGAALLGSMVSLTPGTTTIDIDMERYELLLHVLDASDTDALVDGIRREFEPGLRTLFGTEGTA